MAKRVILYPLIKETTYYPFDNWNIQRGTAGSPNMVKGTLLSYVSGREDNVEYVENREFEETLTYLGYGRGRSSAVFYFKDSTGAEYQMFMTDMDDLLKHKDIVGKEVEGVWTYCKRGQNHGIKLAKSEMGK